MFAGAFEVVLNEYNIILSPGGMVEGYRPAINALPGNTDSERFSGGSGTPDDPYIIKDVWDLQNMSTDLSAYYVLASDINASATKLWNWNATAGGTGRYEGFTPVGNLTAPFTGSLDGRNHTIIGLYIDRYQSSYVGLFGYIARGGVVKDLKIITDNRSAGQIQGERFIGVLAGYSEGTIVNCHTDEKIWGGLTFYTGGLAGYNNGVVRDCSTNGSIFCNGLYVGGIVGYNNGTVINCHLTGKIVYAEQGVGGVVGHNDGTVVNSSAAGDVSGDTNVGGFVGENHHLISNCHSTGDVRGDGNLGGFAGYSVGTITNCFSTGNVSGVGQIGGFTGYNGGSIINCSALGSVGRPEAITAGGFVGANQGTVRNSFSCGDAQGYQYVGGFAGKNRGEISLCYSLGNATGCLDSSHIGGLVGYNEGTLNNTYARGWAIGGNDSADVGGLVGRNTGTILNSYATGRVRGYRTVGGLVGGGVVTARVINSFWDINTTGLRWSYAGTGKSTVEMMMKSTFSSAGWDFERVWFVIEGVTYPMFKWQDRVGPVADAGPDRRALQGEVVILDGSRSTDNIGIVNWTWYVNCHGNLKLLYGRITTFVFLEPGVYEITLKVTDGGGWWDTDTTNVTVLPDEVSPVANAGEDVVVDEGSTVVFNGSGSRDNVGVVNWTWSFYYHSETILLYGMITRFTFETPGVYFITLNVSDIAGNWDTDVVNVTVRDTTPPIAYAGGDIVVNEFTTVIFNGSGSRDNVGVVNWTWSFYYHGETILLYGMITQFTFETPGTYVVTLNVSDAWGNWATDNLTVYVLDVTPPTAEAGADIEVDEGSKVVLDGSRSHDNVGVVNWTWSFAYGGEEIVLYGEKVEFIFDIPGTYHVTLNVSDTAGNWGTDVITVTVRDITPPVANAGGDVIVDEGTKVTLNGSGSRDNVGVVNWTWSFAYGGKEIVLYGEKVEFVFDIPGTYHVTLNVSDTAGNWGTDVITVTVNDITPPVADAGPDVTVELNDEGYVVITLDGSESSDNVGIVNWTWNFTYHGKEVVLYGPRVSFKITTAGTYIVTLTVKDEAGNIARDTLVVTVNSPNTATGASEKNWTRISLLLLIGGSVMIICLLLLRRRGSRKEEEPLNDISGEGEKVEQPLEQNEPYSPGWGDVFTGEETTEDAWAKQENEDFGIIWE